MIFFTFPMGGRRDVILACYIGDLMSIYRRGRLSTLTDIHLLI